MALGPPNFARYSKCSDLLLCTTPLQPTTRPPYAQVLITPTVVTTSTTIAIHPEHTITATCTNYFVALCQLKDENDDLALRL